MGRLKKGTGTTRVRQAWAKPLDLLVPVAVFDRPLVLHPRQRNHLLRPLIFHAPPQDLVHRLLDNHAVANGERDEGVWPGFDIANQFGVQNELFPPRRVSLIIRIL